VAAGVPTQLVPEVACYMKRTAKFSKQAAIDYLKAHNLYTMLKDSHKEGPIQFCALYVEVPGLIGNVRLHVIVPMPGSQSIYISIEKNPLKHKVT